MFGDSDDDMFAEDEAAGKPKASAPAGPAKSLAGLAAAMPGNTADAAAAQQPAVASTSGTAAAPSGQQQQQKGSRVDYASWPVKELRRFLQERGQVRQRGVGCG